METYHLKTMVIYLFSLLVVSIQLSCKKFLAIDEPINSITTTEIFRTDATATAAMAGVYSTMINGTEGASPDEGHRSLFSAGLSTILGGLSSDELYSYAGSAADDYGRNRLTATNSGRSAVLWSSAYNIIYKANSVIEGIAISTSPELHDDVREQLIAEAKFVRAFCYFYLCNFFGDVPMALTVDFNQTTNLPRMPKQQVYAQVIKDLEDAEAVLPIDYSVGKGERIIPNKWAATFLLARVYLYLGDYNAAASRANKIINNKTLFELEADLSNVFATNSREAIWQLKQTATDETLKNATAEGLVFLPRRLDRRRSATYCLTKQLLNAFEPDDQRKAVWADSTTNSLVANPPEITYYPFKYTLGVPNAEMGAPQPQYYMVFRLAEAYLIRAEARANGATGGQTAAIDDLNEIRKRAGLTSLVQNLNQQQVIAAVAQERRIEFFAEWGHRWLDLKRTGQGNTVLSVIPGKQPWLGDYQLLYPIPSSEISIDHFLIQNPGY